MNILRGLCLDIHVNCIEVYFQQIKDWEVARNSRSLNSSHGDFNLARRVQREEVRRPGRPVQCRQSGRARRRVREERREGAGVIDWHWRERDTVLILFIMPPHTLARAAHGHQAADSTSGSFLASLTSRPQPRPGKTG